MCMKSLSEIAKDVIRGYMKNENEYDRKELVAAIREKADRKEEMTDGVIAGAIKMLTASGELVVVARGRYQKGIAKDSQNMQEKVTALFHKFKSDLDKMCMVNALNLTENDFQFISKINEISNHLEASIRELEELGKEKEASGAEQAPEAKGEEVEQAVPEKEMTISKKEPVNEKKENGTKKEKKEQKEKEQKSEVA